MSNPFDPERLKLPDELIAEHKVSVSRKEKKRRKGFTIVPGWWQERLTKARNISTYRVALHILRRHWENGGKPFTLSNGAMALENVSRNQKWRALGELEQLGLVAVERCRHKSPLVTIWDMGDHVP